MNARTMNARTTNARITNAQPFSACTIRSPTLLPFSCFPLPALVSLTPQIPDIRHRHQVPNHHPSAHHPFAPYPNIVILKYAAGAPPFSRLLRKGGVFSRHLYRPPFPQNTKAPSDVQVRGGPIPPSRLYKNHPKYRKSKSSEIGHRSNPSQNGKAPSCGSDTLVRRH